MSCNEKQRRVGCLGKLAQFGLGLGVLVAMVGCGPVCSEVEGACLALRLEGSGTYDGLDVSMVFSDPSAQPATVCEVPAFFSGRVELPVWLQLRPPSPEEAAAASCGSSELRRLTALWFSSRSLVAPGSPVSFLPMPGIDWPRDSQIEATFRLIPVAVSNER